MLENLRGMAVFATVANSGSFRAAAKRLGLSASVVSHHVTTLERQLDTPLLYRTTRKLSLTDAGRRLAVSANAMMKAAEEGFGEIGHGTANPTGSLKITAPAILQYARFVTRVSTFMRHHPKVDISLTFTDRRVNIVEEGLDLAFRVGNLEDSSLMSRKLADGRLHVCASPKYVAEKPQINGPNDLEHHELINLEGVPPKITVKSSADGSAERVFPMSYRLSVDSGFAARRMAQEGCGLVVLPDFFVRQPMKEGSLVEVLPDLQASTYGIYAVWPPNSGTNHLRNSFLNFVAEIARTEADTDLRMERKQPR